MDDKILHQDDVEAVVDERLANRFKDVSDVPSVPDVDEADEAAGEAPTTVEFNALVGSYNVLVGSYNTVLQVLRDAGLIPPLPEEGP